MFWIFKIFPDWIWWLGFLAGLFSIFASYVPMLKPYALLLKIGGGAVVLATIFIFGMLWSDNTWKQAARELQARVDIAEAQSREANTKIETKIVTKTQVIKQRAQETVKYIDREVVRYDTSCVIPPEFISAHNKAATK